MQEFKEVYDKIRQFESDIQSMKGQRIALKSQLEELEQEKERMEKECNEKFGCSLKDLDKKIQNDHKTINDLFEKLRSKMNDAGIN